LAQQRYEDEAAAADAAEVEGVVRGLFTAAEAGDLDGVRACLTDDLLLFKVGRIKGLSDLTTAVSSFVDLGGRARYTLYELVTHVGGDVAAVSYRSRALIELPNTPPRHARWLESAVLVRTDRWRIAFFHSTDEVDD